MILASFPSRRAKNRLLLIAIIAGIFHAIASSVAAHGGGVPMLVNGAAGPYVLSVWMAPDPLRVGDLHLTIAVSEPAEDGNAGEPILGAAVRILLTTEDQPNVNPVGALATHQDATNRLFYEADVAVTTPGNWRIMVMVDGPLGRGESTFSAAILPEATTNWFLLGAIGTALLATVIVGLVFQRRRRTHHEQQSAGTRRRDQGSR